MLIGNPAYHLSADLNPVILKYNKSRALIIPAVFVCVFFLSFINPWISYIIPPFMPIVNKLVRRHYIKKYPDVLKAHLH